jgi:glycosyltransferase involved in cell wall biosynthesis
MKAALFICDPNWSTGNIAKCVAAALPDWRIDTHDWSLPFHDITEHDAVVSMSMTGPARNSHWRTPRIAHVLAGPGEMALPEVKALRLPAGTVLAGVSVECAGLLRTAYPAADSVHVTPGFAHPTVFTDRGHQRFLRGLADTSVNRVGFVGHPVPQNMQVSGSAKRPEMFQAICTAAGVEAVFSEQRYKYEDMQKFYDSIDILISTSAHEGGPFSPLEAIACGVPALSTDVGVVHDMLLPGCFNTIEDCVRLIPYAVSLLPAQRAVTAAHAEKSIHAWDAFLHQSAHVRAGA